MHCKVVDSDILCVQNFTTRDFLGMLLAIGSFGLMVLLGCAKSFQI